jgi:LysM repeat protein
MEVADLRHALHGAETDVKLLEERLEGSDEIGELKQKIASLEKSLEKLSSQTSAALAAYKQQIASIEGGFGEISKLRSALSHLSKTSYQVKAGDSLGSIARKLQVSVEALKAENNLSSDKIVVGQELAVPPR